MPGSCSSNTLNGCSSCAPGLVLFSIEASTSQSKVGFGCLSGSSNDRTYYKIKTANGSENFSESDSNIICYKYNLSLNYSEMQSYSFIVDKFGFIAIGLNALIQMNFNEGGTEGCEEPVTDLTNNGSYFYQSVAKKNACEEDQVTTYGELGNIPGSLYCTPSNGPFVPGCNENCQAFDGCERNGSNHSSSCYAEFDGKSVRSNGSKNVNSQVFSSLDWDLLFDLTKQSTTKKLEVLKNNQPQNCNGDTCGEGKDACWGGGGCFGISDNNLDDLEANTTTSQKLKFKIGTAKEGFDKTYKSVSGKVKFYISSEEDIEEGRTPCCNDDFSGTVVKETGYSISAGSTFKNDYLASDAGDFDNNDQSHVGETICPCYTIDSVSFI
jgi:hypothetical protein